MKDLLIIQFAKWPEFGKVKTRLAISVGNEHAFNTHITLMETVFNNISGVEGSDFELWLNKDGLHQKAVTNNSFSIKAKSAVLNIVNKNGIIVNIQQGKTLGDKMAQAFILSLVNYRKVIIVGSDCPNVCVDTLKKASEALKHSDMVIQPAEDGGYVLIGARRFQGNLFDKVEWGQGKVLQQTLMNIEQNQYSYSLLDLSWDVDDVEDYHRWINS